MSCQPHKAEVPAPEREWIRFIRVGPSAMAWDRSSVGDWMSAFRMGPGDTMAGAKSMG